MKIPMQHVRLAALGILLAFAGASGAAATAGSNGACCYPGSVVYYNDAGQVVGVRMYGCGDPGWGVTTSRSRTYNGCIM